MDLIPSLEPAKDTTEQPNRGHCGSCGWSGKLDGLEREVEQDGWEMPEYSVGLCPECGDALDDYYFVEEDDE